MAEQRRLAEVLGAAMGVRPEQTLAVATGMIGPRYPMDRIEPALERLVADGLTRTDDGYEAVTEALRTTDSRTKSATVRAGCPTRPGRRAP